MKQAMIQLAKHLMIPIGMLQSLWLPADRITILMYHRVNNDVRKEIAVRCVDFHWQMEYLKRKGYRVIPLDEALNGMPRQGKCVVLTFDDGYEDFYRNAFPVLQEYGYPSIVYLVPGYIGSDRPFWWDIDLGESSLMRWEQIQTLAQNGIVRFGSHTMSHADLNTLDDKEVFAELSQSKNMLEQMLATEIRHFAYPRGIMTRSAVDAARLLYQSAVSIFDGNRISTGENADPMKLTRLPVQRSDGRRLFGARLRGWLAPEGWLKLAIGRH